MTAVLLDTHVWAWSLNEDERLGEAARSEIARAGARYVSPISFYEIGQKVRLARWPEMAPLLPRLGELALEQGVRVAALTAGICLQAATSDWAHRDPFDRIIAASALALGATLISADGAFDTRPGLRRVW